MYVPGVPNTKIACTLLVVIIIFVRAGWRANTVSCSLPHSHDRAVIVLQEKNLFTYVDGNNRITRTIHKFIDFVSIKNIDGIIILN